MLTTNPISKLLVVAILLGVVAVESHRQPPEAEPSAKHDPRSMEMFSNGDGIWHSVNGDPDIVFPIDLIPKSAPVPTAAESTSWLEVCNADLCARLLNL